MNVMMRTMRLIKLALTCNLRRSVLAVFCVCAPLVVGCSDGKTYTDFDVSLSLGVDVAGYERNSIHHCDVEVSGADEDIFRINSADCKTGTVMFEVGNFIFTTTKESGTLTFVVKLSTVNEDPVAEGTTSVTIDPDASPIPVMIVAADNNTADDR